MSTLIRTLKIMLRLLLGKLCGVPQTLLEEMPDCPALFHSYRNLIASGHKRVPGGWVYEGKFYPDYLTMGGSAFAIKRTALKYCKGQGLDIGPSHWPLPGSTPIDTESGPGTANKIEDIPEGSQDYVFSSHCLEHICDWGNALDTWIDKLKPDGLLFLYLPHPACKLWHMSNPQMAGTHKWVPEPVTLHNALTKKGLEVIDKDDGPDHFYSFFICARKPN